MKVISVLNSKGGVGKTTTVLTLASILALYGVDVLVVDMAPQGNASISLVDASDIDNYNIQKIIEEELTEEELANCIKDVRQDPVLDSLRDHLNVITSSQDLNQTKTMLYREDEAVAATRLQKQFERMSDWFDIVIIDNDPALDILAANSLVASDFVLSPVIPDLYSFEGSKALVKFINQIKREYKPELGIKGFLPTHCKERKLDSEVILQFKDYYDDDLVMKSRIRHRSVVSNSISFKIPIPILEPENDIVLDYMKLIYEMKILEPEQQMIIAEKIINLEMKLNEKKEREKAKRRKR